MCWHPKVAALRGQMSTVLDTLASTLQEKPVTTDSEVHAAVAGLSALCESTLKHCQETAGAQVAVAAKLAELQEETSVVAAALHRLRGIFQGDVENAMKQMLNDVTSTVWYCQNHKMAQHSLAIMFEIVCSWPA
eukprot:symbB.v1.2.023682.t1/scaffold2172.1/size87052/1